MTEQNKDENTNEKIYEVKLDLGLSEKQAEYIVDKIIMPLLYPGEHTHE